MNTTLKLSLAGAALLAVASTATAAELRLSETEMDRVTAGQGSESFQGVTVLQIGPGDFEPFPSTTFGGFDLFEGPLTPPPPAPEPDPVLPPPLGGGSPVQLVLGLLLGLLR